MLLINFINDNKSGLLINYYMASKDLLYIAHNYCIYDVFLTLTASIPIPFHCMENL